MLRRSQPLRLDDEVHRFEEAVSELAYAIIRSVLADELASRPAAVEPLPEAKPIATEGEPAEASAAPTAVAELAVSSSALNGKRLPWTRDRVIDELAQWLMTGQVVEAAFVTRHGRPGLVAAAKRLFGRFDAALNAANVHLSRVYPDGLPTNR